MLFCIIVALVAISLYLMSIASDVADIKILLKDIAWRGEE